jgi:hypothetical protein
MSYPSVDKLQKTLAENVFHYAKDSKKASGRALGTLIEIITFYLIKDWGFESSVRIEKGLIEYLNEEISHNVEYTIHPIAKKIEISIEKNLPMTTAKIFSYLVKSGLAKKHNWENYDVKSSSLLSIDGTLRNACVLAQGLATSLIAVLKKDNQNELLLEITEQIEKPFAMFECKRVGVEEGMKKGPQTIEKAKQGAYVARTVSSLQKIRNINGKVFGALPIGDGSFRFKEFSELLDEVVNSSDKLVYANFILTVGFVSNHGNWFTAEVHNKELRVLSNAYDWLLFLTDRGLAIFIDELLLNPKSEYLPVQKAFLESYDGQKGVKKVYGKNQFTKVQINEKADLLLQKYFREKREDIKTWINVISPKNIKIDELKKQITKLSKKDW